ncbi:uncharacterized protein [Dermacentor albipictus]|uniref:uncharacterized protein n=1 Tax=Dermacentor albipictus TaxID=60249 RepID=UPI0038FC1A51
MLTRYACCVCHVIPSATVLLPCCHALCEQCQRGSVVQDGGSVCPLDGEPFCEDECQKWQLPERKKQNLKAHCWNEDHGCDFVGPLAVLLQHFEAECAFHTSQCQRCGENIPNARLAAHYIGGCGASNFSSATLAESSHQGQRTAGDVTATAQEIEGETGNRYEDEIPVLQSQVNELTETARAQGAQLQDLNATLAVSLEALNAAVSAAAEKLSDAIGGEASQLHERVRASRVEESSRANEAEASASDSDVRLSLQGEATDILRSLEVLAAQYLWCHERSLQAHNGRGFIPELRILLESQSGTPRLSCSRTCTPRCKKGKEIVYAAVIFGASKLRECGNPTLSALFRYRRAWCSATFGTLNDDPYGWALRLNWNTCRADSCLPHVVSVGPPDTLCGDFVTRETSDPWQQIFYIPSFNSKRYTMPVLKFDIVINDCE